MQEVQPGGPADKAGLKAGDIITTIDGRSIKDGDDLVNEIASRKPGSTIRLGYVRDGKPQDTTVTIGDRDKVFADLNNPQPESDQDNGGGAGEAKLGVVVQDAPPATVAKIHTSGVLIESVRTGSFADLQGLEPGLVITHVNRQPTATKEQFDAVVEQAQDRRRCGLRSDRPASSRTGHQLSLAARCSSHEPAPVAMSLAAGAGFQSESS